VTERRARTPLAATTFLVACLVIAVANTGSADEPIAHTMADVPTGTEEIDPTTKEEVLDQIERSELYVLDVENIDVHIHVQFVVQVNGVNQVIPQTGVDFDTLTAAPIHTHDTSGILHIENDTSNPEVPTVADFLEVWVGTSSEAGLCNAFLGKTSCSVTAIRNGQFFALDDPLRDVDTVILYINDDALV